MLDHYNVTSGLISDEIKQLMTNKSPVAASSSATLKRKNASSHKSAPKKSKSNKENPVPSPPRTATHPNQRVPFANLLNVSSPKPTIEQKASANATALQAEPIYQTNKSYMNIQFNYTPRLSYTCCTKMLQVLHCSESVELTQQSFDTDDSLIGLIINPSFVDYVIKNVERKLKSLQQVADSDVYDPESFESEEIFSFLSETWVVMCQRVNGTASESGQSAFTHEIKQNFTTSYLVKIHKYMEFCDQIWRIVQKKYQKLAPKMIDSERMKNFFCLKFFNSYPTKV